MTENDCEKKKRRLQRKKALRNSFIVEAMFENGFSVFDVLNNDLENFAYLLKKKQT